MTYFVNIKNNKINGVTQINNSKFSDENNFQIEINEEIFNNIKNSEIYKYENNIIVKDIEATKNINIQKLKKETESEILEVYPINKQLDIIARIGEYTDQDFSNMKNFIEEKVNKYKISKNNL